MLLDALAKELDPPHRPRQRERPLLPLPRRASGSTPRSSAQVERRDTFKRWFGHPLFIYATVVTWLRHYDRRPSPLRGAVLRARHGSRRRRLLHDRDEHEPLHVPRQPAASTSRPRPRFDRGLVVGDRSVARASAWPGRSLAPRSWVRRRLRDSRSVDFRTDLEQFEVIGARAVPVPGRRRLPRRDRPARASATSPTRSSLVVPDPAASVSGRGPARVDATSGTFVQMPSTPSATSSSMPAGIVDGPHVHLEARGVAGVDERGVDEGVVRVEGPVARVDAGSPRRRLRRARPSSATRSRRADRPRAPGRCSPTSNDETRMRS